MNELVTISWKDAVRCLHLGDLNFVTTVWTCRIAWPILLYRSSHMGHSFSEQRFSTLFTVSRKNTVNLEPLTLLSLVIGLRRYTIERNPNRKVLTQQSKNDDTSSVLRKDLLILLCCWKSNADSRFRCSNTKEIHRRFRKNQFRNKIY